MCNITKEQLEPFLKSIIKNSFIEGFNASASGKKLIILSLEELASKYADECIKAYKSA